MDEHADLKRAAQQTWDQIAGWWDEYYTADGNAAHRQMIAPAALRLLDPRPGEAILDAACGNGAFARRLAGLGARVTAFDFSAVFLERARAHTAAAGLEAKITYHCLDATDETQLLTLGAGRFEAVVCLMALMDMPVIAPLFRAVRQLLRPAGRFVFGVLHPCFNSARGITRLVEEVDEDGALRETYAVKISRYLTPETFRGLGIAGQPAAQYYFHRPLHLLLQEAFAAGFVLDGLEEPPLTLERNPKRALSWSNFSEIPPFLLARLRPAPYRE